jgi:hypothetical protein
VTQPSFVPITDGQRLRPVMAQPTATHVTGKAAEMRSPEVTTGDLFGSPGPDQGYALLLAHHMSDSLVLRDDEDAHDVEVGAALLAGRRASLYGRAPAIYDLQVALGIFGFLTGAPADLVEVRQVLFRSIGHSYAAQRRLVDAVPERSLRMTPDQAASSTAKWRANVIV